jgi:hypothetical protein
MRTAILVVSCLLISSWALATDQQVKDVSKSAAAKPVVVASAKKPARKPVQSTATEFPPRVWTVEMSCCEPQ